MLLFQVPPAIASLKVVVPPTDTNVSPVIMAGKGILFTVTPVVYTVAGAHPGAEPLLTVTEYTAVTVGVADGFNEVVDDSDGPLHA